MSGETRRLARFAASFRGASSLARSRRGALAGAVGGAVFALTSPPTDLAPAVFVGLGALAHAVATAPTHASAFRRGVLWGTTAGLVGLRFVPVVIARFTPLPLAAGVLALVLLSAAQALAWGLGALAAHVATRRLRVPGPLAFGFGVFAATLVPTVFAWTPAGLLSPTPELVQLAELVGERGVSALFGTLAAGLALVARDLFSGAARATTRAFTARAHTALGRALVIALAFAGLFAFGRWRIEGVERERAGWPELRVALVDQSVGATERWDPKNRPRILGKLHELTREAERAGAELTVWPEAAHPYPVPHDQRFFGRTNTSPLGHGVRGPLVIGAITQLPFTRAPDGSREQFSRNSTILVDRVGRSTEPADKLQLLWFGEMVPLGRELPWLRRLFQRSGGLMPGDEPRALALEAPSPLGRVPTKLGVLNCYEDTLTGVGRRVATETRANLLVNVTNDAWFFDTAEPELHARLAVMRAIENRVDLVRAVNRGVVSWISASGRVEKSLEPHEPTVVHAKPRVAAAPTSLYRNLGDLPMLAYVAFWCLAYRLAPRRRAT